MHIGVPRERKDGERRVGMLPEGVAALVASGHVVQVEQGAGEQVGFDDAAYARAGAVVARDAAEIFGCPLIVKVKELQRSEWPLLQPGTLVMGFAQLGRDPALLEAVLQARIGCIAYETVAAADGSLPLLAPMSRIAGRLAPLIAASLLTNDRGGSGVLLPGLDGVAAGCVVILGAGNAGGEAARVAADLGCAVRVFGRSERRLALLRERCRGDVKVSGHDPAALAAAVAAADVVVGAVLEPGTLSPKLLSRAMLRTMRQGLGTHRHRHRPGRHRGNVAHHHALRSELCRGRRGALLRAEHAGARSAHGDVRADARNAALCAGARAYRHRRRARRRRRVARGTADSCRRGDARGPGGGFRPPVLAGVAIGLAGARELQ